MAFTAAQKTLMCEALELFEGGTYDWYDYVEIGGIVTSVPFANQINFSTAMTRFAAVLAAIEAGSTGAEARIGTILTAYSAVSLEVTTIEDGGASGAGGVRYDPAKERMRLGNLLRLHLGFNIYKHGFAEGDVQAGTRARNSGSIPR